LWYEQLACEKGQSLNTFSRQITTKFEERRKDKQEKFKTRKAKPNLKEKNVTRP